MLKSVVLYSLRILFVMLLGASLWLTGLILFTRTIPSTPPPILITTDGIVIFTGGKTRLNLALGLFQQKYAEYLLISGVNPDSTFSQKVSHMTNRSQITLGYDALDTVGNAEETAAWARTHNIKTLRLITSNYHMPRSLFELRYFLPTAEIIPHPVVGRAFLQSKWWLDPTALQLVIQEYHKFIFALIRRPFKDIQEMLNFQESK